jgi:chromosomal replication initiation ATPase DnaA
MNEATRQDAAAAIAILKRLTEQAGVPLSSATRACRYPHVVAVRHAWWRTLRNELKWSISRIGRATKHDHTTVLAALRKLDKEGSSKT